MKLCLFLLITLALAIGDKPVKNLSTAEAAVKYATLLKDHAFLVYPELRENPIKWFDSIPEGKIEQALHPAEFVMNATSGEFFVFQLGVWALKNDLSNVDVEFSDLTGEDGQHVASGTMTCFNEGGLDIKGKPFSKEINIAGGRVQALWIGIDLEGVHNGKYSGAVSVLSNGQKRTVPLKFIVAGKPVSNHGYNEGRRLSRLNWLNSTTGIDEQVTKGYLPVTMDRKGIHILGRTMTLDDSGLPASIISYFSPSNQSLEEKGTPIVSNSFRFIVQLGNGDVVRLKPGKLRFSEPTPSMVKWTVLSTSKSFDLECAGQMEFDGFVDYKLKLTAKIPVKVKDIRLEVPVNLNKADYMMGLGHEGGLRAPDWNWKWDVTKNQDMLWVGAVNGGIRVKWKGENYVRPLVNIYYKFSPLNLPQSWANEGNGGVNVGRQDKDVVINAYSGSREMEVGEQLNYDFELLITPFRVMDRKTQFEDRYFHGGGTDASTKVAKAKKVGANIINIHHAEDIYPFINYPYLDANTAAISELVKDAHKENIRLKLYYTTRELTKNLPEFWAFNSLDGEVIFPGPGNASRTEALHPNGPNEWLVKNMRERYIPAWYNEIESGEFNGEIDLSVITTPDSRLNNFYIAGLDWMVQNMGIDGVYIDDSALDRFTVRRARKVIDRHRPEGRMDLHSWNHFNDWAGYANCLNLYMDLLPYIDLVWIGEGRDYDRLPDHWLVEVSGIPFGLPGQMLQGGGNAWRGMVYGITNRAGWTKNPPEHLWKFFDEYSFADREMVGYWEENGPVSCTNPSIKATVFKGQREILIAVANWTDEDQLVSIDVDWKKLGINPLEMEIIIPEIENFQTKQVLDSLRKIVIPGKKGYLIVIRETNA